MGRFRTGKPSPSMVIALVALSAALVGTAIAAPRLTSSEENQVGKIAKKSANKQIKKKEPDLDVRSATTASGLAGPLATGETLRGVVAAAVDADGSGEPLTASVSYPIPLDSAPTTHVVQSGSGPPVGCSGNVDNPGADQGHLCVFIDYKEANATNPSVLAPTNFYNPRYGFVVTSSASAVGFAQFYGNWAVTGD